MLPAIVDILPILPLRNSVLFPASVVPINVGRPRSVRLVEELLGQDRALVGVLSQKTSNVDEPSFADVHSVGTVARVIKVIRLGPSNYSVVLHGLSRFRCVGPEGLEPYMKARVERISDDPERDADLDSRGNELREATRQLLALMPNLPKETAGVLDNVRENGALADLIAANLDLEQVSVADRQSVLEILDVRGRIARVLGLVQRQLQVLQVRQKVTTMVEDEGKNQREQVLRQQVRSIREELGESNEDDEVEQLRERIRLAQLPEEAQKIAKKQLGRIASIPQQSAEFNVSRTYLEWLSDLPWAKTTPDKIDVQDCRRCLEEDHFGLEKVKKRILEYMAVRKLRADKKGPILCFLGPPGVGKTSLGRSIARSMGRRYHRIALGGVRDEAEIRGHRRTYVGALPGRIIQGLKKVGVKNPVFVLDEIDKMGQDMHGDPSAALLEVLDPAQNDTFQDHYIDTPFDLSQVTFLATANDPSTIPRPLMDRMELIEVSGYTRAEKLSIAREFLGPRQISSHGLTPERLEILGDGYETIIESYTREAGVRNLEREIGAVCRHAAMRIAEGEEIALKVNKEEAQRILGVPRYVSDMAERSPIPGLATGLAWTPSGGDVLFIEVSKMPGKGDVKVTGNLRSVMQESAHTALSFVRSRAALLGLDPEFLRTLDLHLHFPKGGTPKDGPSAGVTIYSAIVSLLLGYCVRRDLAMTGEITLRGAVLPVGGIKEKLLAAHRAGIRQVLIPKRNEKDLDDVPTDVRKDLSVHLIARVEEILPLALEPSAHVTEQE
jgi:ATP-dependent Lon protease